LIPFHIKLDGFVKSPFTGHCEERSEEAISGFQAVTVNEIASSRVSRDEAMTAPATFYEAINLQS